MNFTVHKGKRYEAAIHLGLFESVASNDAVAEKFRAAGFTDVAVTGSGHSRTAVGTWPGEDATAPLPSEVTSVRVL